MKPIPGILTDHTETGEALPSLTAGDVSSILSDSPERLLRSGMLSIFDQGVVSGANFLTTLILARACPQDEVGIYSLAWTIVLFLVAIQGNLITVPYTMYCHRRSGDGLAEYAGSTFAHQLITSLAAVACIFGLVVALSLGFGPTGLRPASWVLLGAIPFILLREYARRFTFAHLALATAVTIDVVVAVLQLSTLLALWWLGFFSAAVVYGVMGAACAIGGLCWWFWDAQPIHFSRDRFFTDWGLNWSFGKWALLSQLTGLAFYLLPWILASVHGEAETGELHACATLVGLSNLFVMGLNNLLMPKAARAFVERGPYALSAILRKATVCAAIVLGGLCVFAFFAGNFLAGIIYGAEYADTGLLITMLAVATLIDAMGLTASTGLWAMDRPAANIAGDVVQLLVTLGSALWLVFPMGATGIATALVLGRSAGAAVRWFTLRSLLGFQRCDPEPVLDNRFADAERQP